MAIELRKFPPIRKFAWKSTKEQKWNTTIKTSGSGRVRTLTTWQYPQYIITAQYAWLSTEEYRTLHGFISQVRGSHEPFLWLDPEDYEEKGIRLGSGRDMQWQAVRRMGDFIEPVAYVENVTLYADGKKLNGITVDGGLIKCTEAVPEDAVITADYTYYWKVRLSGDSFQTEARYSNIFTSKAFKLMTTR